MEISGIKPFVRNSVIFCTLLTLGSFFLWGKQSAATGFFAGGVIAGVNMILLYAALNKMKNVPSQRLVIHFFKTFVVRMLVMIALFALCLFLLKVHIVGFFAGNILFFHAFLFLLYKKSSVQ